MSPEKLHDVGIGGRFDGIIGRSGNDGGDMFSNF